MAATCRNLTTAFGFAVASNLINNLPVGLIGASALHASAASGHLANAMLMGIDLGPNLSVTGSLATILWLIALRRENLQVSAWSFLKVGVIVMPLALLLAGLAAGPVMKEPSNGPSVRNCQPPRSGCSLSECRNFGDDGFRKTNDRHRTVQSFFCLGRFECCLPPSLKEKGAASTRCVSPAFRPLYWKAFTSSGSRASAFLQRFVSLSVSKLFGVFFSTLFGA